MVENTPVLVPWRSSKPPERVRSTRAFRNPPQPHMCVMDFIEGSHEPCFINVMSWDKIGLPMGPDDSIPLYGGMLVPHSPPTQAPVFAVMANPEVLRVKGKNAADPQETYALVLMMLDFVELMNRNRGLHFARHFQVLRDRDLAGELKNVWTAVQIKRVHDTAAQSSLHRLALQQQHQENLRQHDGEEMQCKHYSAKKLNELCLQLQRHERWEQELEAREQQHISQLQQKVPQINKESQSVEGCVVSAVMDEKVDKAQQIEFSVENNSNVVKPDKQPQPDNLFLAGSPSTSVSNSFHSSSYNNWINPWSTKFRLEGDLMLM